MKIELVSLEDVFRQVDSRPDGLTNMEATARLARISPTSYRSAGERSLRLLLNQFSSPLVILLLVAMVLSLFLGDRMDVVILAAVVMMSTLLGFWQEYRAA